MRTHLVYGILVVLAIFVGVGLTSVAAHVEGGKSEVAGPYVVELATDPSVPIAGQDTTLSISIQDAETESHSENVMFELTVHGEEGTLLDLQEVVLPTGDYEAVFAFPYEGHYDVMVRVADGSTWREAPFEIQVSPLGAGVQSSTSDLTLIAVAGLIALVIGLAAGYLLGTRSSS